MKIFWLIDLIIPVTMISLAFYYNKKAEKEISQVSGFRTSSSMSSKESWYFSHKLASKILMAIGLILICFVILIKLIEPISSEYLSLLNNAISIIAYIWITLYVNNKTKSHKNF